VNHLDARRRAMLAEMGVRVWTPAPAPVMAAPAPRGPVPAAASAVARQTPVPPPAAPVPVPAPHTPHASHTAQAGWRLEAPQPLYAAAADVADVAGAGASAPRWLVALDSPTPDDPGSGEAGDLLHNMLQAMGLKGEPSVFVSTVRRAVQGAPDDPRALRQMLDDLRPAIVLALGLSAARCVLGGGEPLERLRAREHRLPDGTPVIVSYAPSYLVRAPKAKREAGADLQRAMALAAGPSPPMP